MLEERGEGVPPGTSSLLVVLSWSPCSRGWYAGLCSLLTWRSSAPLPGLAGVWVAPGLLPSCRIGNWGHWLPPLFPLGTDTSFLAWKEIASILLPASSSKIPSHLGAREKGEMLNQPMEDHALCPAPSPTTCHSPGMR